MPNPTTTASGDLTMEALFRALHELELLVDKFEERQKPPQKPKLTPLKGGRDG